MLFDVSGSSGHPQHYVINAHIVQTLAYTELIKTLHLVV